MLQHAGTVEMSDDIRSSKWMKLVANAGELVPSAILDVALADAVRMPGVHEFMVECGKEAARAAVADGSASCRSSASPTSRSADPTSTPRTCSARCSTSTRCPTPARPSLQDWMKGRHSEMTEVNGLVVDVLARAGQTAPYNAHTVGSPAASRRASSTAAPTTSNCCSTCVRHRPAEWLGTGRSPRIVRSPP